MSSNGLPKVNLDRLFMHLSSFAALEFAYPLETLCRLSPIDLVDQCMMVVVVSCSCRLEKYFIRPNRIFVHCCGAETGHYVSSSSLCHCDPIGGLHGKPPELEPCQGGHDTLARQQQQLIHSSPPGVPLRPPSVSSFCASHWPAGRNKQAARIISLAASVPWVRAASRAPFCWPPTRKAICNSLRRRSRFATNRTGANTISLSLPKLLLIVPRGISIHVHQDSVAILISCKKLLTTKFDPIRHVNHH